MGRFPAALLKDDSAHHGPTKSELREGGGFVRHVEGGELQDFRKEMIFAVSLT